MSKLTKNQIRQLAQAYTEFRVKENAFKTLRDKLTKDLDCGKYISEDGQVSKTESVRNYTDWDQMIKDHPEIDITKYQHSTDVTVVKVTSTMNDTSKKYFIF